MKKNRIKALIIVTMMLPALIACGKSSNTASDNQNTTIANPVVEVTQDGEFSTKLGIDIDTSKFDSDVTRNIIADKTAEVIMTKQDPDGKDVKVTLRATKDSSVADNMSQLLAGIYDDNMSEPVTLELGYDSIDSLNMQSSDANGCEIYSFVNNDVYYTLTIDNGLSQMTIGAILDNVAEAIK